VRGQRGELTGANPVDGGKAGSRLHLAGDRGGLPLALVLSGANSNDATLFEAVLDDIPPILMPTKRAPPARQAPRRQGVRPSALPGPPASA
jgi:hypothetical protein